MVILVPISPFAGELVVVFSWRGVDCEFSTSPEQLNISKAVQTAMNAEVVFIINLIR